MAESELSLDFDGLADAVSNFLFGNPDYDTLAADDQATVGLILQSGYRQFLYPPSIEGIPDGYEWTFLFPWTSIDTIATYDTGTLEVAADVCTLTGGVWPSWAYTHGILVIDGTEVVIASRDSNVQLTLDGADDVTAGEEDWTLGHNGNQTLPDDFGRFIDGFYHNRGENRVAVLADVGPSKIIEMRSFDSGVGEVKLAGINIEAIGAGATGQRRQVMWWPRPNAVYTMWYRYESFVGELADGEYPVGAMKHVETLKASCIAEAELQKNDEHGPQWLQFARLLKGSVARDKAEQPKYFGQVGALANQPSGNREFHYTMTVGTTRII